MPRHQYRNGFIIYNNYPYYVYAGYRFRYSGVDRCEYTLVDGDSNTIAYVNTHSGTQAAKFRATCNIAYDSCANLRDSFNGAERRNRYFCAEEFSYDPQSQTQFSGQEDFYSGLDNILQGEQDFEEYEDQQDYDYDVQ